MWHGDNIRLLTLFLTRLSMISIYQLKPAFQGLLRPLVRRLAAVGVTANAVTILAMM
ncbi:MAG: hypothetical protein LBE22_07540 [Azoarcus sp.]|nr:hypothetical protein [Azoarcus sp.]